MMTIMNLITKERRVVYERKRKKEHIHKKRKTSARNSVHCTLQYTAVKDEKQEEMLLSFLLLYPFFSCSVSNDDDHQERAQKGS